MTSSFPIWGCVLKGCFKRGIYLKGPNRIWRALKTSILNTNGTRERPLVVVPPLFMFRGKDLYLKTRFQNSNSPPSSTSQLQMLWITFSWYIRGRHPMRSFRSTFVDANSRALCFPTFCYGIMDHHKPATLPLAPWICGGNFARIRCFLRCNALAITTLGWLLLQEVPPHIVSSSLM